MYIEYMLRMLQNIYFTYKGKHLKVKFTSEKKYGQGIMSIVYFKFSQNFIILVLHNALTSFLWFTCTLKSIYNL